MIYIIDTETTGLIGYPYDHVVQIGVAALDLQTGEILEAYSSDVHVPDHKMELIYDMQGEPWIVKNGHMTLEQIKEAPHAADVSVELCDVLQGGLVTSYNTDFDFKKFLNHDPWRINTYTLQSFDIADMATGALKDLTAHTGLDYPGKWGKMAKYFAINPTRRAHMIDAYRCLVSDDDEIIQHHHSALDDAIMEARILRSILFYGNEKEGW